MLSTPQSDLTTGVFSEIRVVDLARWRGSRRERAALAEEVRSICHHIGFFLVVNHGIERNLVDSLFAMMEWLFDLPDEQ